MSNKKNVADALMDRHSMRWTKLAKTCKVIPWPGRSDDSSKNSYNCRIFEVSKVPVPRFLLDKAENSKTQGVQVHVSGTMFDMERKCFFGSTWSGRRLDLKTCCKREAGKGSKWNGSDALPCTIELGLNYGFSVYTAADMANVQLAVELIMTEVDSTGSIRGREYSICWSILRLLGKDDLNSFSFKLDDTRIVRDSPLYLGTPRLLLFVGADPKAMTKAKIDQAGCKHISLTHSTLGKAVTSLMAEDELVSGEELLVVPGLTDQARLMDAKPAKIVPSCPLSLAQPKIYVHDNIDTLLEEYIKAASGRNFRFKSLLLQIGVHNGRRFIGKGTQDIVLMKASEGEWVTKSDILLEDYIANNMVAAVVLLQAKGSMEGDDNIRVCLGWRPLVFVEENGDKGPLIVGEHTFHLTTAPPIPSVSNALVYSEGSEGPKVSFTLGKDAKAPASIATVQITDSRFADGLRKEPTHPTASRTDGAKSTEVSQQSEGSATSSRPESRDGSVQGEDTDTDKARSKGYRPVINMDGELERFSLVCNVSDLGRGQAPIQVDGLDMDATYTELLDQLEKKFGQKVQFMYTPLNTKNKPMPPVLVDDEDKFNDFKEILDDDLENEKRFNGRIDAKIVLLASPNTGAKASPAAPTPAKNNNTAEDSANQHRPAPTEPQSQIKTPVPSVHGTPAVVQRAGNKLKQLALMCNTERLDGRRDEKKLENLRVEITWAEVRMPCFCQFTFLCAHLRAKVQAHARYRMHVYTGLEKIIISCTCCARWFEWSACCMCLCVCMYACVCVCVSQKGTNDICYKHVNERIYQVHGHTLTHSQISNNQVKNQLKDMFGKEVLLEYEDVDGNIGVHNYALN
jgi:hypothetical protein